MPSRKEYEEIIEKQQKVIEMQDQIIELQTKELLEK